MDKSERSEECIRRSTWQSRRRGSRTFGGAPRTAAHGPSMENIRAVADSRDTSDMRPRLTSSHLVGRVGELAELELASREAATEHPVLVLLGGDSGVGKTRLVAEFERRMADTATLVLRGEAVEQGDGELP